MLSCRHSTPGAFAAANGVARRAHRLRVSATAKHASGPKPLTKTELRRLSVVTLRAELESRNLSSLGALPWVARALSCP